MKKQEDIKFEDFGPVHFGGEDHFGPDTGGFCDEDMAY